MNNKLILETYNYVKSILGNDLSGHDINHIIRVYKIACDIAKKIPCNDLVVKLASLLHDIDDYKITKIKSDDCIQARKFLESKNLENQMIDDICYIINHMSYSKNKDIKYELSTEGKIVQDADRIDALGAIGIARTFQYGGKNNRPMDDSFQHFDDKLIKLYDMLNLEVSKEVAYDRNQMLLSFYDQYKIENNIDINFED